ncbi:MAG: SprB repeat-containing protein [Chitinophagaceae bacterium]|nr:SprB repeat-containing protein [Chitinophagaceae bacterium]
MKPLIRGSVLLLLTLILNTTVFCQCSFNISTTTNNVSCFNGTNGSVTINVTGGTTPYQYQLAEAGAGAWQSNTNIYNGLGAGTYPVSVKDGTGCIKTTYITITQPTQLGITYTSADATCAGANNGWINTTTTGGVAPYSYNWTKDGVNYSSQANISNLSPASYNIVVTDANGCTATPVIPSQATTIGVTGFNVDGIANGTLTSASASTTTSMDASPGAVLFASGYSNTSGQTKTGGIPASGNFISAQDASRSYQLAPFTGNNELLLRSSTDNAAGGATSGTLSFQSANRSTYSSLYVLGTTGSGTGTINYTVNFADATTAIGTLTFPDWYYTGTTNVALGGLNRIARSNSTFETNPYFNLFELPITISVANQSKTINSISFSWSGSGSARTNIFGISGYNATGNGIRINDGLSVTVTPSVTITSNAVSNTFCSNQSVVFTATPVNGGINPSYQWKLNGVNVGTNSPTYTNSSLTTFDKVTVVMTSSLTCVTANPVTSNQLIMTSGLAVASVSIAGNNSICSGTATTFTATPVNGGATPSYQWKVNGVNAGTNSAVFSSSGLANGDLVQVIMTSSIACAMPNPSTSNTIMMAVTQSALPSISITSLPSNPKPGNTVLFTATPSFGGLFPSYQWYRNGVVINGATSATLSVSPAVELDYYSVKLTSSYSCATVAAAMSNFITINPVILSVSVDWFKLSKTNSGIELKWKTSSEINTASYIISRSSSSQGFIKAGSVQAKNLPSGSEYSFNDVPLEDGTYTYRLTVVDRDGKETVLGSKIVNWTGKFEQKVSDFGSSWNIRTSNPCQYELMDMQGRIISRGNINHQLVLQKPASKAIYIIRFYYSGQINTLKLQ